MLLLRAIETPSPAPGTVGPPAARTSLSRARREAVSAETPDRPPPCGSRHNAAFRRGTAGRSSTPCALDNGGNFICQDADHKRPEDGLVSALSSSAPPQLLAVPASSYILNLAFYPDTACVPYHLRIIAPWPQYTAFCWRRTPFPTIRGANQPSKRAMYPWSSLHKVQPCERTSHGAGTETGKTP